MKIAALVRLGLAATLCACSDNGGATIDPTGAGGATAGAAAGAAGTVSGAGANGAAGVGTPPVGTAAGSGGRAAAGASAAGSDAAGSGAAAGGGAGGAGAGGAGAGGAAAAGAGGEAMAGTGGDQGTAGTDPLPPLPADKALPIVFVHGFAGSAQQFQSQAMRFVMNGYPADRLYAYDHDGAGSNYTAFANGVEEVVDAALAKHGTSKVFLIGHSRGTFVSSSFLGTASRAAKVEKYIAVDGSACPSGSVPCVAPTQAKFPGQKHVEVCTSKESFEMQYEFLMGTKPQVVDIVRQKAPVEISGRAVNFPANTGRAGATLKVYPVADDTGARTQADPIATFPIAADGNWGPVTVDPDTRYELELTADTGVASHFYFQKFLRSTPFVRLLSGGPESPARMNTNTSDKHAAMVVSRQREWLASDVLEISTKSGAGDQPAVNVINATVGGVEGIGIHIHDNAATPGESSLSPLPYFSSQPFQYGVDVFMPAAEPTNGTITVRNLPRGDTAKPQVINVPNWPSTKHAISIGFADFPQD